MRKRNDIREEVELMTVSSLAGLVTEVLYTLEDTSKRGLDVLAEIVNVVNKYGGSAWRGTDAPVPVMVTSSVLVRSSCYVQVMHEKGTPIDKGMLKEALDDRHSVAGVQEVDIDEWDVEKSWDEGEER